MIGSLEINKSIRKIIHPILKNNNFTKVKTRNGWKYNDKCIIVFNIRAVGGYFSFVTGFPPMSVVVSLGVYYKFFPQEKSIKIDKVGLLLPPEWCCQRRLKLTNYDFNKQIRDNLNNPNDRTRNDIWWIEPDGKNTEEMVEDISNSLIYIGIPWYEAMTDLNNVYKQILKEKDCCNKYGLLSYFSRELNYRSDFKKYNELYNMERGRIENIFETPKKK